MKNIKITDHALILVVVANYMDPIEFVDLRLKQFHKVSIILIFSFKGAIFLVEHVKDPIIIIAFHVLFMEQLIITFVYNRYIK